MRAQTIEGSSIKHAENRLFADLGRSSQPPAKFRPCLPRSILGGGATRCQSRRIASWAARPAHSSCALGTLLESLRLCSLVFAAPMATWGYDAVALRPGCIGKTPSCSSGPKLPIGGLKGGFLSKNDVWQVAF